MGKQKTKPFYNTDIPDGWEVKSLRELCEICYGKEQKSVVSDNGEFEIYGTGGVVGRATKFIYDKPSILIGRKGSIDEPILINKPFWAIDTTYYTKMKNGVSIDWLFFKLLSIGLRKYNEASGVPSLSRENLYRILFLVPKIFEQRAIAACLSAWDTAINKNNQLIAKKELRKKWLMQQLLTGKKRLPAFVETSADEKKAEKKWIEFQLQDIATFVNGKAYKQEELLSKGKYQVLRVGNFFTNSEWYYSDLELEKDKYVNDGDLMYAWSASFGPRFWSGDKTIYHYHIWKVIPSNRIDKGYLFYFLLLDTEKIFNNKQGGTMFHVTKGDMEKRKIYLPSKVEQTAIATVLQAADKEIQLLKTKNEKLREEKKGLMQQLLTGKKRLKIKN